VGRYVNLGCPERPLSTKDPDPSHLLPCGDADWEQGVRSRIGYPVVSGNTDLWPLGGESRKAVLRLLARRLPDGHVRQAFPGDVSIRPCLSTHNGEAYRRCFS